MMKKMVKLIVFLLSFVALAACENGGASQPKVAGQVQLVVTLKGNTVDEKVDFYKDDTVMDVLKANYQVEESKGFITAIDGIEQDEDKGLYWMFDLNGKLAPKAADQIKVKDGDKIEFYQEVYKED